VNQVRHDEADGRLIIEEIARTSQGTSRRTNRRIPGAGAGAFEIECVFARKGRRITAATNGDVLAIEFDQAASFVVAIGQEDPVLAATRLVGCLDRVPVFAPAWLDSTKRGAAMRWLTDSARLLNDLGLVAGQERLVVAKNQVLALLGTSPVDKVFERVDAIICLADSLPETREEQPGKILPQQFDELQDLVAVWAVADDVRRAERVAHASDAELVELDKRISPHIDAINDVLARASQPLSPRLVVLGLLGEVSTEGVVELGRRRTEAE
jgi:hypothetical protein